MRCVARYSPRFRAEAVDLVHRLRPSYRSTWATIRAVATTVGIKPETLRTWVRQADIDAGRRPGTSTEVRRLRRENAQMARQIDNLTRQAGRPGPGQSAD
jgi:transposase